MVSIWIVLAAAAVMALSGLPACAFSPRSARGQRVTVSLMSIGGLLGLAGLALTLGETVAPSLNLAWFLPWGRFAVTIDPISLVFLLPVFVVPALGSIYGLGYWEQARHPDNGQRLGVSYGLLAGAMTLVAVARDGMLFLIAWELMALAAFFVVTTEEHDAEVRRAGWVYLIATHVGTLCLFAMFALWRHATGSFSLEAASAVVTMPAEMAGAIFVLALVGFGFKAGLIPLHFWLPGAHANAPSHVSAVMSGVVLKMGVYGIVRMTALLPVTAAWWGGVLLATGAVTGVAGIALALGQHDLKRVLAYSSVENIGVIAMGLGLALLGRAMNRADWVLLGLGAALLHMLNHSLFKPLLFFNAGAIIHAVNTREIDRLGGLAKRMPGVTALFVAGAVAICALPPLNGFVSEWLLYVGLFRTLNDGGGSVASVAAVALAMIGALAVACFVKLLGALFLGSPRDGTADHAHDPPASMVLPMVVLAAGCVCLGLSPGIVVPLLDRAAGAWGAQPQAAMSIWTHAPLASISAMGLGLVGLVVIAALVVKRAMRGKSAGRVLTWDCGYARPTPRMQYTGSSFVRALLELTGWIVWPRRLHRAVTGLFAGAARFQTRMPDPVLDRVLIPAAEAAMRLLPWARRLQQGNINVYMFYMLLMVVFLFLLGS